MPPRGTASSEFLRLLARVAQAEDLPLADVWRSAGVPPAALFDPGVRIPIALFRRAWHEVVRRTGKRGIGLQMAQRLELGALDMLDVAVRGSADCGEAFRRLVRFIPLLADAGEISFSVEGDVARFRHSAPGGVPYVAEMLLGLVAERGRQLFGASFRVKEVSLSHPALGALAGYDAVFRAGVRFEHACDEIVLHRDLLDMPNQAADPLLDEMLVAHAEAALMELGRGGGAPAPAPPAIGGMGDAAFVSQARRALIAGLAARDTSLVGMGARLGMSTRTLQRRLRDHGVAHRDLVDEMRIELAERALSRRGTPQSAIARSLGYSSASAFHRAWKRWRGTTPGHLS